jgi:hypothetical protein
MYIRQLTNFSNLETALVKYNIRFQQPNQMTLKYQIKNRSNYLTQTYFFRESLNTLSPFIYTYLLGSSILDKVNEIRNAHLSVLQGRYQL